MRFIDIPRPMPMAAYESAIGAMVDRVRALRGVVAIYQIGHVSTPGISDIDLVVVFEDDARCLADPREGLTADGRYLFAHDLFGVSRADFAAGRAYSFFHNYVPLWGETLDRPAALSAGEQAVLKRQVALEYLVKKYVDMSVEQAYGIARLRGLMLYAKGLLYDCEFLGVTSGTFIDAVRRVIAIRETWFRTPARLDDLRAQYESLHHELGAFLGRDTLYLPPAPPYQLSKNVRLHAGETLRVRRSGWHVPSRFSFLGRSYLKMQRKFNRFDFEMPLQWEAVPDVVQRRFDWQGRMERNNLERFPHFMALSSSLGLA